MEPASKIHETPKADVLNGPASMNKKKWASEESSAEDSLANV